MTVLKQLAGESENVHSVWNGIWVSGNRTAAVDMHRCRPKQTVQYENGITCIYRSIASDFCIFMNIPGYSSTKNAAAGLEKVENLKKLEEIQSLTDDWNGNGAKAFHENLAAKVRNIIRCLDIQPEIFPTAYGTLQLEYDKDDGSHMEIEISESDSAEVFKVDSHGNENLIVIPSDFETINKVVDGFYG